MIKKITTKIINHIQKKTDKKYEKEGFSEDLLDLQLKINKTRAEYNLIDNEGEYLQ